MRGAQEIVVVVRREGELLVMRRAPERLGYWSLVAGGVEPDETPQEAAQRELLEETGLRAEVRPLPVSLSYSLLDDPPAIRARYAPGIERITVHAFVADADRLGADSRRRARRVPLVRSRRGRCTHGVRDDRAALRAGAASP
jgi:8-oxo-dGTP pyrophosphatase MutT (NUDIX family)